MSRTAEKPAVKVGLSARADILSHTLARSPALSALDRAVFDARDALVARQSAQGYWLFELEADCTIPAEYIMMMHYLDEIDRRSREEAGRVPAFPPSGSRWLAAVPRRRLNISCTVKAYYALKLAGDDIMLPHMVRARAAILERGGAARANVFTRIALALFGQLPWRGVPYIPVEIMLLPKWFPFHLDKVAYWSRTVMVPLFILCTLKPGQESAQGGHPRTVHDPAGGGARLLPRRREAGWRVGARVPGHRPAGAVDRSLDSRGMRARATKPRGMDARALNGEDGLGAIFPAMVNALEVMTCWATRPMIPRRHRQARAGETAGGDGPSSAYCQPCVSPGLGHGSRRARHARGGRQRGHRRRDSRARLAANRASAR
jgi:squalene-hopene/tetraprenyl-beta-curcumene cyclase